MKSYNDLGRPDLTDSVRKGRIHQRLREAIGQEMMPGIIGSLRGLRQAMLGSDTEPRYWTLSEYCQLKEDYGDDEGLKTVVMREAIMLVEERDQCRVRLKCEAIGKRREGRNKGSYGAYDGLGSGWERRWEMLGTVLSGLTL